MSKLDQSYGIVPILKRGNEWRVLLIEQISYRGHNDRFWTFPKGHAEAGETPEVAALRELAEETGITTVSLEQKETFVMNYTFVHEGITIQKTVFFYIGYCQSDGVHIASPHEIASLQWCSLEEAAALLSHENSRLLLEEVSEFLRSR